MFAIPGIAALIVFILVRPQEFLPLLQRVPLLHLFAVLALVGWVIDVRLRRTQPIATPLLPWAVAFLTWAIVSVAVIVPELLVPKLLELLILFTLYGTIAHGIQRFRTFQVVAGVMVATCAFVAFVCVHQGLTDTQCVGGEDVSGEGAGRPDGRPCDLPEQCQGPGADPGLEYRCEHVGLFDTHSIEGRVRYRGDLNDPNEVALVIAAGGISLLIAFLRRKRSATIRVFAVLAIAMCVTAVMMTQSRGGQLAMLLVAFVYLARMYGWWAFVPAALLATPLMLFGGRDDAAADASTQLRYEAWAAGLDMFHRNPLVGVGAGQFVDHHYLTAHNSFVLTLAEMGFPGLVLFVSMLFISMKSLVVGLRALANVPGAEVARVWGMALLGSFVGSLFSISTLSFAYKSVLWIMFALAGAWANCIRHHAPEFRVRITWLNFALIVAGCLVFATIGLPIFLKIKGEL